MEPCAFDEENNVLGPPEGISEEDIESLSVFQDGKVTISCWRVTKEELKEITKTGRIWLIVCDRAMPPVILTGNYPFE